MAHKVDLFAGLEWRSSPVYFHNRTGSNVNLTEANRVASIKTEGFNRNSIVFTVVPLSVGQLLKVTVLYRSNKRFGGLKIGITGEDPANSTLSQRATLGWEDEHKHILHVLYDALYYNRKKLCQLGFVTDDIQADQSMGLLLTHDNKCHWFLENEWKGTVSVRRFPLNKPMWGAIDVFGHCDQVKAEICTVSKYPSEFESTLVHMGLIAEPMPSPLLSLEEFTRKNQKLQVEVQELQDKIQELTKTNHTLVQSKQQLQHSQRQPQLLDAEKEELVVSLRSQLDRLHKNYCHVPRIFAMCVARLYLCVH